MNLALEQHVFDTLAREDGFFMLWRNNNAVIIGLHQNTAEEVDLSYADGNGIKIVRRLSGGGAVFHDLGNLNFTFITNAENAEKVDAEHFTRPIAEALECLGVEIMISGRNDMTINGRKFSGNASCLRGGRLLYHGTLLFDTDLDKMSSVLRVSNDKIVSKGISSVRDRVTNIRDHLPQSMSLDDFWAHMRRSVAADMPVYMLAGRDIDAVDTIRRERYDTWDWNFGRSPGYSIIKKRLVPGFGTIRICMEVKDGKIAAYKTDGDYFGNRLCDGVAAALYGARLAPDALRTALSGLVLDEYYRGLGTDELVGLIIE